MKMYSSQEAAIARRAREKGISVTELTEYFEKKVQEVEHLYVSRSTDWRLGRAEYLVWTHFFPGEAFPGKVEKNSETQKLNDLLASGSLDEKLSFNIGTSVKLEKPSTRVQHTEVSSVFQKLAKTSESESLAEPKLKAMPSIKDEHPCPPLVGMRSTNVSRMDMPWLHDKFEAGENPVNTRQENIPLQSSSNTSGVQRGRSYYPILGPMTDSYRPSSRDLDKSISRRSSCPSFENIKKPSVYISLENIMQQKAWKNGLSKEKYENIRERFRMEVKLKHAQRGISTDWCLWKEEVLTWIALFSSEDFPGLEPLQSPHATSASVTGPGCLENSPTTHAEAGSLKGPLKAADLRTSSLANRSLKKSPLVSSAASHTKQTESRQATAARPRDNSRNLQPEIAHSLGAGATTEITPEPSSLHYASQEKVMEEMAKEIGLRHEFFSLLQRVRDFVRLQHGDCERYVRGYLSDRLVWHDFFAPHIFPGIKPDGGHCKQCINRGTDLLDLIPNPHRPRVDFQVATFMQLNRYKISRLNPLAIQARLSGSAAFQYGLMHVRASTGRQNLSQPSNSQAIIEPSSSPQLTARIRSVALAQAIESPTRPANQTRAGLESVENDETIVNANQNVNTTEEPAAFVLRGNQTEIIPCSHEKLKNLLYSFMRDRSMKRVEATLHCYFKLHTHGPENCKPGFTMTISQCEGEEKIVVENASRAVRAWVVEAFDAEMCTLSSFLESASPENIVEALPSNVQQTGNKHREKFSTVQLTGQQSGLAEQVLDTKNLTTNSPTCANPSNASKVIADELDRLISKERAKAEGASRLVFDEEAAEVITLGELVTRIVYRAALKLVNGASLPLNNGARDPASAKAAGVFEPPKQTKKRGAEDYGDCEGNPEKRIHLVGPEATLENVMRNSE